MSQKHFLMKKVSLLIVSFLLFSCAELQEVVNKLPNENVLSQEQIAQGLKEALNKGISNEVSKLTKTDGFYKNSLVKILLPQELQKVDNTLRDIGLGNLADEGLLLLNRAAENAVKEATPIFVNAVKQMSFADAKQILLGNDRAATDYLSQKTRNQLYSKFNPIIKASFDKVGANDIWNTVISKYNALPMTSNVNPDLTDYVTEEALKGVFTMIAIEEKDIRNNIKSRTTDILRRVFALQDNN